MIRTALRTIAAVVLGLAAGPLFAQGPPPPPVPLGPPPVPVENPITEAKRVLGKVLFWDEQLSSNDTVACGTCHRPGAGGSDPRVLVHPGPDEIAPSPDDILGSPGIVRANAQGMPVEDPIFGLNVQVTSRSANSFIGAAYAPELFWDGRAPSTFTDPESGAMSIVIGGALEGQAVGPILSDVEMAREGRTWDDVRRELERSLPLRDATNLPADVAAALEGSPGYPELFAAAFGDPQISAERIAYAIATYERTLVPNETPWDAFVGGNPSAMTQGQVQGWDFFRNSPCQACHVPPTFTDHSYRNIGMRPPEEDLGRQDVTGLAQDRGRFKVPTLRNVGLKPTHMHNGRLPAVADAVLWYRPNNPQRFGDNLDPALPVGVPPQELPTLVDFLTHALTDPRVAAETFPFDRPNLHGGRLGLLTFGLDKATMTWPPLQAVVRFNVYRGDLAVFGSVAPGGLPLYGSCISTTDPNPADTVFVDTELPEPGEGFFYLKSVVDSTGAERGLGATSDGRGREVLLACE